MPYSDVWRCKRCEQVPEVLVRGKSYLIKCHQCPPSHGEVFGHSLDEVVRLWNQRNDPVKRSFFAGVKEWCGYLADWYDWQLTQFARRVVPPSQRRRKDEK